MAPIQPFKRAIYPEDEILGAIAIGVCTCSCDMPTAQRTVYNRVTGMELALNESMPTTIEAAATERSFGEKHSCIARVSPAIQSTLAVDNDLRPDDAFKRVTTASCSDLGSSRTSPQMPTVQRRSSVH